MFLTNLSQVLARHDDLLNAASPLLVNMPQDNFADYIQQVCSADKITFYDTQFDAHQFRKNSTNTHATFHCQYHSTTLHDLVIMTFPKSKKELTFTLAMLSESLTENARILVVGENKSGIKSIEKLAKSYYQTIDKIDTARHCVLYELTLQQLPPFTLDNWFQYYDLTINDEHCLIAALPGVFSQEGLDKGTKILFEHLPSNKSGHVLDFGTGAGVIATYLAKTNPKITVDLADVSALALASAKKTLQLNQLSGNFIATNSLSAITRQYDHVVTNPPFHQGTKTHYAATENFLAGIHKHIKHNGTLTVVANSFLKYQPIMEPHFKQVSTVTVKQGFAIYLARN